MAFDLKDISPGAPKTPEQLKNAENREARLEVPQAEQAPAPEQPYEQPAFKPVEEAHVSASVAAPTPTPVVVDEKYMRLYKEIDKTFGNKRVAPLFKMLPPDGQQEVLTVGAEMTEKFTNQIRHHAFKDHAALVGTRKWLGIFPKYEKKTSKAFLEQEAKLDLEALQRIAEEEKESM